jgi:formiminoglutamase
VTVRLSPPDITVRDTGPDDRRLGHLLGSGLADGERPDAIIVGFPTDEGVQRNRGRPGAAQGPGALRKALYQLAPDGRSDRFHHLLTRTRDLGDLVLSGQLETDQRALADLVAPHLAQGVFLIVLGGGHETSYGHFLGYVNAKRQVDLLNWDAHADVRELREGQGHSGSPFRQALDHPSGACRRYLVAGLEPQSVARAHLEYVAQHGRVIWREDLSGDVVEEIYQWLEAPALVSFDLDALNQTDAPGVSAPNPGGISRDLWLRAAEAAGGSPAVASVDVVELNPQHDVDGHTARLAALTVWRVLRGRASRL